MGADPPGDGPARVAGDILKALVEDLKLRPGDFVYEKSLDVAFASRGLSVDVIGLALHYAQQQGWLILDPDLRVYTLTQAGIRRAPS